MQKTTPHMGGRPGCAPAAPCVAVPLSSMTAATVDWIWPRYIPRGMLSLIDGNPGEGKSLISLDIAARVTRGWAMPPGGGADGSEPANVLICNAEDDPARTIRPRLEAMGADIDRVHLLTEIPGEEGPTPIVFPGHLRLLEDTIAQLQVSFVVIDPLAAFLGADVDSHKDSDIRRVLARVKRIAEKTQAAILVVRHLNKMVSVGEAVYRGGGSIGIIGAARSALLVAKHPATPCVNVLARTKGNLCQEPPALAYVIENAAAGPVVAWLGEHDISANDLLGKSAPKGRPSEALAEAEQFLNEALRNGPVSASDLFDRAAERQISGKTLRRAQGNLGVQSRKSDVANGAWVWHLPDADEPQECPAPSHNIFGHLQKNTEKIEDSHEASFGHLRFSAGKVEDGQKSEDGNLRFSAGKVEDGQKSSVTGAAPPDDDLAEGDEIDFDPDGTPRIEDGQKSSVTGAAPPDDDIIDDDEVDWDPDGNPRVPVPVVIDPATGGVGPACPGSKPPAQTDLFFAPPTFSTIDENGDFDPLASPWR